MSVTLNTSYPESLMGSSQIASHSNISPRPGSSGRTFYPSKTKCVKILYIALYISRSTSLCHVSYFLILGILDMNGVTNGFHRSISPSIPGNSSPIMMNKNQVNKQHSPPNRSNNLRVVIPNSHANSTMVCYIFIMIN